MALLTKKRASKDAATSAAAEPVTTAAEGAKRSRLRPNERLGSVIKETTFGASVEALDRNLRFRLVPDADGNPRWLALLLPAESIGGLSEKTKRDEAKGSLVQQIVSDQIEVVATSDMLEHEHMAIVPSQSTLERMGEYSLLTGAQYFWVVFSSVDGELRFDQNIGPAKYADAVAIQGGGDLQSVISDSSADGFATWARIEADGAGGAGSAPDQSGAVTDETPSVEEPAAADGDEDEIFGTAAVEQASQQIASAAAGVIPAAPELDEVPDFDDENFYENLAAGESESFDDLADLDVDDELGDLFDDGDEFSVSADADSTAVDAEVLAAEEIQDVSGEHEVTGPVSAYDQYVEQNREREFVEDDVRDSIVRRFLADELELVVDMGEFEKAFSGSIAPQVNVSTAVPSDSTDWLGAQIAQMAEAANAELAALHRRHDEELRQLYIDYTGRHIENVIRENALTDPEAKFGSMMKLADGDFAQAKQNAHTVVLKRRQEIDQRFTDEADKAAEAAAAQARATHAQMNRGRRDTALAQVDRDVTQDIQARYENERQQVLRLRRVEAELGLQRGKTVIFEEIAETRGRQSDAEASLLAAWNAKLLSVVDENRKIDIARAEALAENLARTNAVEDERRLGNERIEALRADHAARVTELEQRVVETRDDAIAELQRHDSEWQRKLGQADERTAEQSALVKELQTQITSMSASIHAQYQEQIDTLRTSREAYSAELDRVNCANTRTQKTVMFLLVLLVIAALAVGAIAGWVFAHSAGSGASAAADVVSSVSAASAAAGWA